jgi:hypothetical protein
MVFLLAAFDLKRSALVSKTVFLFFDGKIKNLKRGNGAGETGEAAEQAY